MVFQGPEPSSWTGRHLSLKIVPFAGMNPYNCPCDPTRPSNGRVIRSIDGAPRGDLQKQGDK
eukprot:543413-Pyramimonas_sp.AAC.1